MTRRSFLSAALVAPWLARQLPSNARLLGTIPLDAPAASRAPIFGRLLGTGLDARMYTDLSTLGEGESDARVTPSDRFFVRTAAPSALRSADAWRLHLGGLVSAPLAIALRDLEPLASGAGPYLIECAGNPETGSFGLMSTAEWRGVPLPNVLDRVRPTARAYRVLVSGVDHTAATRSSVPGASWIFSTDDLHHALLAVGMNGAPLARDHGFPVRLVVPGWYGCACVKWVDRIDLVPDEAPATPQMIEFAARTHQDPRATLAREFVPAVVDTAAMPIRIEKWLIDRRLAYRVVGLVWGGTAPTNKLAIRFKANQPWMPVDHCPLPASTLTWSVWTHLWRPAEPGRYDIVLKVADPSIRTRRLDLFFYVRTANVDEV